MAGCHYSDESSHHFAAKFENFDLFPKSLIILATPQINFRGHFCKKHTQNLLGYNSSCHCPSTSFSIKFSFFPIFRFLFFLFLPLYPSHSFPISFFLYHPLFYLHLNIINFGRPAVNKEMSNWFFCSPCHIAPCS